MKTSCGQNYDLAIISCLLFICMDSRLPGKRNGSLLWEHRKVLMGFLRWQWWHDRDRERVAAMPFETAGHKSSLGGSHKRQESLQVPQSADLSTAWWFLESRLSHPQASLPPIQHQRLLINYIPWTPLLVPSRGYQLKCSCFWGWPQPQMSFLRWHAVSCSPTFVSWFCWDFLLMILIPAEIIREHGSLLLCSCLWDVLI